MLRRTFLLSTVVAMVLLPAAPALADDPFLEGANLGLPKAACDPGKALRSEPPRPTPSESDPGVLPNIQSPPSEGFGIPLPGCFTPLPSEVMNHNIGTLNARDL